MVTESFPYSADVKTTIKKLVRICLVIALEHDLSICVYYDINGQLMCKSRPHISIHRAAEAAEIHPRGNSSAAVAISGSESVFDTLGKNRRAFVRCRSWPSWRGRPPNLGRWSWRLDVRPQRARDPRRLSWFEVNTCQLNIILLTSEL